MTKTALYARVSTRNNGQDPETQLLALRQYAKARRFEVFEEYVDIGISGAKESRPALDQLMNDARKRRFDAVLVARFDRFARSTRHLVLALEEFSALGVDFLSLSESIDTSTPMGKMVYTVIAAVAELERSLIRERVVMGLQNAKAKGKQLGRPTGTRANVRKIHRLKDQGLSLRGIAGQLNVSKSTVSRALKAVP
ncbi:recombinase family protein [Acidobacteria bacterium AH-259-O06]|nr:recombinase family protein [Acidobacteria bacterium AH-259-O06]